MPALRQQGGRPLDGVWSTTHLDAIDELVAYWLIMRSIGYREARNVGQNRAASEGQNVRNATSGSKGRRGTMPTGSGSI